ncbi:hypothetical protein MTO96_046947 [Rhipicephalus appendiculatus]
MSKDRWTGRLEGSTENSAPEGASAGEFYGVNYITGGAVRANNGGEKKRWRQKNRKPESNEWVQKRRRGQASVKEKSKLKDGAHSAECCGIKESAYLGASK